MSRLSSSLKTIGGLTRTRIVDPKFASDQKTPAGAIVPSRGKKSPGLIVDNLVMNQNPANVALLGHV
jgi:hypothetical protein